MKKIISLILAVLMLCCTAAPAFAAEYKNYSDVPIIYFQGQGADIVDADGNLIYPIDTSADYIADAVTECIPDLINAITDDTDENWNIYRDRLLSYVSPLYDGLRLDKNGEATDGSHVDWSWTAADIVSAAAACDGKYDMQRFVFRMDWRLDPFDIAESFHEYVLAVKAAAGADKVNVVFRCEANGVMAAYYSEYGYNDFNCVEMYVSSLDGFDTISAMFSGNFSFDSAAVMRFLKTYEENLKEGFENDALAELMYNTLYIFKETYTLEGALKLLTPFIKKIYQKAIAPAILVSYGTFPGIWSLVCEDEYEDAKKWIFNGVEDEYAGLIAKLDNYHNNVSCKTEEILEAAKAAGVKTAVYAKYGEYQTIPISTENDSISDGSVTLTKASCGAVTADYTSVLSGGYIDTAKANGTDKYISPDKKVDASACIFKDTTWIIFNSMHKDFTDSIHELMMKFFATDGTLTVFDDASIPQYLYCSDEASGYALSPLTAENGFETVAEPSTKSETKKSLKDRMKAFVQSLIAVIRNFLVRLFSGKVDLSFLN